MDSPASVPVAGVANPVNAIVLPFFALLGIAITYFPLRSFYAHRNIAACSLVAIADYLNLCTFINAIIWPNDDWNTWWPGYGLCDIQSTIRFPITTAFATSLCCLSKGLADALDTDNAVFNPSRAMKRRKVLADILFCWGVPIIQVALRYVVVAGRYSIVPVFGCAEGLDNSWPTIVIMVIWCPIFLALNIYYTILTLVRLRRHRSNISGALNSTGSGLAPRKFMKLILISLTLLLIYFPVQVSFIYKAFPPFLVPYSWSRIHDPMSWNPVLFLHTSDVPLRQYHGWANVGMSAVLFLYFGFNDDAIDSYRRWCVKCGLGKIFPSLKAPRERRNSRSSGSSLGTRLDLVSRCMKYVDGSIRKASQATSSGMGSTGPQSRKNSTFDHSRANNIVPYKSNSSNPSSATHSYSKRHQRTFSNSNSDHPSSNLTDIITPVTTPLSTTILTTTALHGSSDASPNPISQPRGLFGVFRTQINLPFGLFGSTKTAHFAGKNDNEKEVDLEAATSRHGRTLSLNSQPNTVSTNIWSGHGATVEIGENEEEHLDPLSPTLGSRAYRERERREAQRERSGAAATGQIVVPGVHSRGDGEEMHEVVVVNTRLERKEETS